ncbi:dual-action HEIGH metallo-peptidase [Barrientosiimonas humi]|uniref:Dual-action HEIGH metallo-peptidase n=2 Tax=Barrientosiimonas TaxID=1535207 RepID=A0A542XBE0_9MICO|nr:MULTISPECIES: M57 family metalloprotease [Barrientosiimonas]TQL33056.1 dual-action HEIGH metallo-peptidase [Barrientosiimonas humi]BDZ57921.1 hypothetical protein GCM10025872_15780 [Barrientosiimonas endolithica]CAG7573046.1 hypothetical protein BH39T_PBIAJDOK_01671 [Barrientosiimonas humi]
MRTRKTVLGLSALAFTAASLVTTGPASAEQQPGTSEVPTFEQFERSTAKDPQGQYIVNGDMPIKGKAALRDFYEAMTGPQTQLVVNTVYGNDDVWSPDQARQLTYCVSDAFGADKQLIVDSMASGAGLWEQAASGIDFVYQPEQDGSCTTANDNVVFSVEPVQNANYIARAFFPSSDKPERNVLVDVEQLQGAGNWTPTNVLGHELGHTLGFRHEHTRPEAGTCFEDNSWRPLTPYDSASIMHYPQCNGTSSDLSMTQADREGVASIYG